MNMRFNAIALAFFLFTAIEAQYRDGDIRLVGGSYQWEGRVEIYFSGTWGTITDSQWTSDDAQAVCRKMGYFRPGAIQQTGGYFGAGSGPIHLDYVVCTGTEYNLTDCQIGSGTRDSSHSDDVGVKCNTIDASYRTGDIRLVGGPHNWEGRVEILWSGTWSAISDTTWRIQEAQVVCRKLGLPTEGAAGLCCAHYGQGSGQVLITSVSCSGDETNITECSYSNSTTLDHQNDVGVRCRQGGDHKEGDIRLVGGSYQWQGRVEIYLYGEWGTITDDGAGNYDAHVVCWQLGYDTRGKYDRGYYGAYFGEGIGTIHLNYLRCSGHEYRLLDCPSRPSFWAHDEDWSVSCENDIPEQGEVRLFYDEYSFNSYRGLVEVWLAGGWGRVNEDAWTIEDGEVVCRQLGFGGVESLSSYYDYYYYDYYDYWYWDYYYGYNNSIVGPTHMSDVHCVGTESRLIDCPHTVGGSGGLASLRCSTKNRCISGDTRLTGGETAMEGRVEVCNSHFRWGTVCNRQWTPVHTEVVCRSAGFSGMGGSLHKFDGVILSIAMDFVNCSGSEFKLWDCLHFTHSYGDCSHSDDAGVRCQPVQCVDGDMKLLVGQDETSGTVLVCLNKRWGTICDDQSRYVNWKTVCRQLGYDAASGRPYPFRTQLNSMPVHIESLQCSGEEFRILDCHHVVANSSSMCTYNSDLLATCIPADCKDGEVRLAEGGLKDMQGRLEVCFSGRWGTVSGGGWTQANAEVICNDLGYDFSGIDYSARPATNAMPIFMEDVWCSGKELSILDCSYNRNLSNNQHSQDVGVQCNKSVCNDGVLRLRGSESEYEGLLEVCFSQSWGTVNGDGWSASDTQVACRQLGFDAVGQHSTIAMNSVRSGPIYIDNVACYGSEDKLIDCTYHTDTSEDTHAGDIWIDCSSTATSAGQSSDHSPADNGKIDTAVIVAVIAAMIGLLALVIIIAYIICNKQSKIRRRLVFSRGKGQTAGDDGKSLEDSSIYEHQYKSAESSSTYEPLTTHSLQIKTAFTGGRGSDDYKLPPFMKGNDDGKIYETCA